MKKKITIEQVLEELNNKIEHFQTPKLRAEKLKKLLELEYNNHNNINLLLKTQKGLKEMLNEMDQVDLISDIKYSIKLLDYYVTNNSFNISNIPINKFSHDLSIRYNTIKELIIEIIKGRQNNKS